MMGPQSVMLFSEFFSSYCMLFYIFVEFQFERFVALQVYFIQS